MIFILYIFRIGETQYPNLNIAPVRIFLIMVFIDRPNRICLITHSKIVLTVHKMLAESTQMSCLYNDIHACHMILYHGQTKYSTTGCTVTWQVQSAAQQI